MRRSSRRWPPNLIPSSSTPSPHPCPPQYKLIKEIGTGVSGLAVLAYDSLDDVNVVLKLIPRGPHVNKNVEREIFNLMSLRHPNVIAFLGVFNTPSHLAITMEYGGGGELFSLVTRSNTVSEAEARHYLQQICCGLWHCHRRGIYHRDLKLENLFLGDPVGSPGGAPAPPPDAPPPPEGTVLYTVKLGDFGYSKSEVLQSACQSTVGTAAYIAPEVLFRNTYAGDAADVWSMGVTLYVMLCGCYPFEDAQREHGDLRAQLQRIIQADFSYPKDRQLSPEVAECIESMLVADPRRRATIPQLLRGRFLGTGLPQYIRDDVLGDPAASLQPSAVEGDEVAWTTPILEGLEGRGGILAGGGGGDGSGGWSASGVTVPAKLSPATWPAPDPGEDPKGERTKDSNSMGKNMSAIKRVFGMFGGRKDRGSNRSSAREGTDTAASGSHPPRARPIPCPPNPETVRAIIAEAAKGPAGSPGTVGGPPLPAAAAGGGEGGGCVAALGGGVAVAQAAPPAARPVARVDSFDEDFEG